MLLDQLLTAAAISPHDVAGPELHSHLEIAVTVASGTATSASACGSESSISIWSLSR